MKIKKILISQPKPTSEKSPYYALRDKFNIEFDFRPLIKVEAVKAKEFRKEKINILDYTAIIFNARHGIDHFFRMCGELRITVPETMKYFCVSEVVANYLQKYIQYRKRKIFFSPTGKFPDLLPLFEKHNKEKYLYITSNVRNEKVFDTLENSGINFDESIMYQTVSNDFSKDKPFDYDMVVFFSPVGIEAITKNFPKFEQGKIKIGCFGTSTAKAVKTAGLRLDLETPKPGVPSFTRALEEFLEENRKETEK